MAGSVPRNGNLHGSASRRGVALFMPVYPSYQSGTLLALTNRVGPRATSTLAYALEVERPWQASCKRAVGWLRTA